ncbi:Prmt5, partial [Symbiodinium sp. CCMP2456]
MASQGQMMLMMRAWWAGGMFSSQSQTMLMVCSWWATPKCFEFSHPNWQLTNNDRYAQIDFISEVDSLVHGFAGYFHCELYAGLSVSINPESYSEGMFSWFPIYFPIRTPVVWKKGEKLESHWWRCSNDRK